MVYAWKNRKRPGQHICRYLAMIGMAGCILFTGCGNTGQQADSTAQEGPGLLAEVPIQESTEESGELLESAGEAGEANRNGNSAFPEEGESSGTLGTGGNDKAEGNNGNAGLAGTSGNSGNVGTDKASGTKETGKGTDAAGTNSDMETEGTNGTTETGQGSVAEAAAQNGYLVVIDAGHQQKGNSEKEPIGPGAAETKAKVAGGTSGATSGLKEYELTLMVAEKLEAELQERGYQVIMVRTSHDVNMSNSERAQVANDASANAFVRIHANGSENTSVHGAMTICQTASNPYNADFYQQSRDLSDNVLDELVAATGCKKQYVWETDTMSGINWCQVPVTIVEMGYMTNPEEDTLMATDDYQEKIADGIANGIDKFFSDKN